MSAPPPAPPRPWRRRLRRLALAGLALSALAPLALWLAVRSTPFPADALAPARTESRRLLDRHGRALREALSNGRGRGIWRGLDEVSPWVPKAFIALEDRRFAHHPGLDARGVARAVRDNLRAGRVVAGGSTLTQQVVKLTLGLPRTLGGKLREALWALRLERTASKAEILAQYINRVPFGHGAVGIEAAARLYLDTPADRLSLAQAALLAGVPRAPSVLNPLTAPDRARARQRSVLRQMQQVGFITEAQAADALAEPIRLVPPSRAFQAPHFTAWALGHPDLQGTTRTTLDLDVQHAVEEAAQITLRALREKRVGQAAAVVLHTRTGEVLAWLGSGDFFADAAGQVDMVLGRRQPGSTLKPFVYGLGLESGLTELSALPDFPLFFPTALGDYRPRNYDRRYHGWVTLRSALANSYNVPAVWMAQRVGVGPLLARLKALGFDSLDRPALHYGLGLALGNGEVRLIELTNAFRALANGGRYTPWRWRLDQPPAAPVEVMPGPIARLLTDILADPIARAPAFGRYGPLELPFPAAAKTGTSSDFTDNWTVGYTTELTVGVWVGNFDGRPMQQVSGVEGAGRLYQRIMRALAPQYPPQPFPLDGLARVTVCRTTGAPPEPGCPRTTSALLPTGERPRAQPLRQPAPALRVLYPDDGDVFSRDADTPTPLARLRLRADAPPDVARLVFELDGQVLGEAARPFQRWWPVRPGPHRLRVWPAGEPARASAAVRFTVVE